MVLKQWLIDYFWAQPLLGGTITKKPRFSCKFWIFLIKIAPKFCLPPEPPWGEHCCAQMWKILLASMEYVVIKSNSFGNLCSFGLNDALIFKFGKKNRKNTIFKMMIKNKKVQNILETSRDSREKISSRPRTRILRNFRKRTSRFEH